MLSEVAYEVEIGDHVSIYHIDDIRPSPGGNPPPIDPDEEGPISDDEWSDFTVEELPDFRRTTDMNSEEQFWKE